MEIAKDSVSVGLTDKNLKQQNVGRVHYRGYMGYKKSLIARPAGADGHHQVTRPYLPILLTKSLTSGHCKPACIHVPKSACICTNINL